MKTEVGSHAPEELLERYAMRELTERESESLEDHLMFCRQCQDELESVESFLLAARQASRLIREEQLNAPSPLSIWSRLTRSTLFSRFEWEPLRNWFMLPASAAALAGIALFLIVPASRDFNYQQVRLEALRGSESYTVNSQKPIEIILNVAGLLPSVYRVEVVGSNGETISTALAKSKGDALTVRLSSKLRPGLYWVRLHAPGSNETLREFPLRSK